MIWMEAQEMDNIQAIRILICQSFLRTILSKKWYSLLPSLGEEIMLFEWRLLSPWLSDHENYGETGQSSAPPL